MKIPRTNFEEKICGLKINKKWKLKIESLILEEFQGKII